MTLIRIIPHSQEYHSNATKYTNARTQVLKKRHRYRESRDRSLNEVHHARLEEGKPPSDWWGLYGSEEHRKEVIRNDIERHMTHEFKNLERRHSNMVSPEKLLGGERQMRTWCSSAKRENFYSYHSNTTSINHSYHCTLEYYEYCFYYPCYEILNSRFALEHRCDSKSHVSYGTSNL